ncbi:hypothetical protein [Rhodohalobacter mucosus]|nr:hypothetical protein [Rhodohalobacter mucosus]
MNTENRRSLWISLISIAGGAILAWLGYGSLEPSTGDSLLDAALDAESVWPVFMVILGFALLVSGITGMLRGK